MPTKIFPLVSLALPLHNSRRFLDIIIENLETLEYPNLEILISDRHCADDALEVLETRFGHDARFHFFRARDEINWVAHYNFLLRAAAGKYFFGCRVFSTIECALAEPSAFFLVLEYDALWRRRAARPSSAQHASRTDSACCVRNAARTTPITRGVRAGTKLRLPRRGRIPEAECAANAARRRADSSFCKDFVPTLRAALWRLQSPLTGT